jgi:hypothetical protein
MCLEISTISFFGDFFDLPDGVHEGFRFLQLDVMSAFDSQLPTLRRRKSARL